MKIVCDWTGFLFCQLLIIVYVKSEPGFILLWQGRIWGAAVMASDASRLHLCLPIPCILNTVSDICDSVSQLVLKLRVVNPGFFVLSLSSEWSDFFSFLFFLLSAFCIHIKIFSCQGNDTITIFNNDRCPCYIWWEHSLSSSWNNPPPCTLVS